MTEPTQEKAPTVDELVATFADLDDAALKQLHDDERATDGGGRTTLLDAIHREQSARADAAKEQAEADKVAQAKADEKARAEGYADAAAKRAAEDAAADKAAEKKKKGKGQRAAKKAAGFDLPADADERLRARATEGGQVTVQLGDDKGPDANLTATAATLAYTRGKPVNRDRLTFSSAGLPATRRFTHVYALDGKTVLGKRELAAPLPLTPGEQAAFGAGTLAFAGAAKRAVDTAAE